MIAITSKRTAWSILRTLGLYLILVAVAGVLVLPFFWMISTAFKTSAEIYAPQPVWIPSTLTLDNFRKALAAAPFGLYARNTLLVAGVITASTLFFCALAGYAFGRMQFWGRETLFTILILAMVLPGEVTLIPRFLIAKQFPLAGGNDLLGRGGIGLIDSFSGIIVPQLLSVFGVFLLRQFFRTLPRDLEDAARIDGASEWGIFWRVMLPLAKPALATLGIFTFTGIWDEFVWPLVILNDPNKYMVQLGLSVFFSEHAVDWGPLMAASTLISVPVIVVFLLGQRFIVKGIATTGLKG